MTLKLIASGIAAVVAWAGPAVAAERYDVNWSTIWNEVSPDRTTITRSNSLTLIADGDRVTLLSAGYTTTGTQDQSLQTINGNGVFGYNRFKLNRSSIVNTTTTRGAVFVTSIFPDGAGGCRASTVVRPPRGQRLITWYGSNFDSRFSSGQAVNETCRLQSVPGS